MKNEAKVCAVIVNYRTADLTRQCIASLAPQLESGRDLVVVVDNASGKGEAERLASIAADPVGKGLARIVLGERNGGFSAGNNAGIAAVKADFYLLTNSDTVFLEGAVQALLEAMERNPKAGIASPRLEFAEGGAQVSCFRYHTPLSEAIRSAGTGVVTRMLAGRNVPVQPVAGPSHPEWTSFACVLVRASAMEAVGPMDEGFFMYYEDVDYCRRMRAMGYDIVNWPASRVVHLQGRSSDFDSRARERKPLPDYYYHSRARYYLKYYGRTGLFLANVCWILGRLVSLLRQVLGDFDMPVSSDEHIGIWKRPAASRGRSPVPGRAKMPSAEEGA